MFPFYRYPFEPDSPKRMEQQEKPPLPTINTRRDDDLPQWLVVSKEKNISINIARRNRRAQLESNPMAIANNSYELPIAGADTESQAQK